MNEVVLPSSYQSFIHVSRYARWLPELKRRETWAETVDRYLTFMHLHLKEVCGYTIPENLYHALRDGILRLDVMPSMRALMTAGPALLKNNIAAYNCAYAPVSSAEYFSESLCILMHGTGQGFSVVSDYVKQLPMVPSSFILVPDWIVVEDSKEGWVNAFRELLAYLFRGLIPRWDTSLVRPAGARLNTFGGRASGPAPLENLFRFTVSVFKNAAGRRLRSVEAHDLACMIARAVVVGGVRRSAMISLSDINDDDMRAAKHGDWRELHPYRALANNSVYYREKPDMGTFFNEWKALYESKSGERGIFYRWAAIKQAANGRRVLGYKADGTPVYHLLDPSANYIDFGTNPCSEIILRPHQFCNLTEVVVREHDNYATLKRKVQLATILGTYQSTLTNFVGLAPVWTKNTEEERLLGVSLTGVMDHRLLSGQHGLVKTAEALADLKRDAIQQNYITARELNIPQSAAITCVKPSGTVSQLVDSASGIHARHSPFYIRRVRADKKDPLAQFMMDIGIPHEDDAYGNGDSTSVFSFPVAAPKNTLMRRDRTAIEQLELWKVYQDSWCEHKPSATIDVREEEWLDVGAWVYRNFDDISGVSFLPTDEHTYAQAPYEEISERTYVKMQEAMPPNVDWTRLSEYEMEDNTTGSQSFACSGNACEIVDLVGDNG